MCDLSLVADWLQIAPLERKEAPLCTCKLAICCHYSGQATPEGTIKMVIAEFSERTFWDQDFCFNKNAIQVELLISQLDDMMV